MKQAVEIYPQRKESLVQFANDVFLPVKDHLCVTCLFVPGGGKRTFLTFLLREKKILQALFGLSYQKTLFVHVNPDEVLSETNDAYLQLLLDTLLLSLAQHHIVYPAPAIHNPLQLLKHYLSLLVADSWHTVFLLNDFGYTLTLGPSIYRNLETILEVNKKLVTFVFLAGRNVLDPQVLEKFHNLKYAVSRIVRYRPLLTHEERAYLLERIAEKHHVRLTASLADLLERLCGGHPQLLKYSLTALVQAGMEHLKDQKAAETLLLEHHQLSTICGDIWRALSDVEQQCVLHVYRTRTMAQCPAAAAAYLRETGLVRHQDKEISLFGGLFAQYVQGVIPVERLVYLSETDEIYYGPKSCGAAFTPQEFRLLTHLITKHGAVVSRDEVGQVLWGKDYFEKYSDWMIDKIISTIRKKLYGVGFPSGKLTTLKKRGFYLQE